MDVAGPGASLLPAEVLFPGAKVSIPCKKELIAILEKYKLVMSHTARRTGATLMYLAGMDIFDIMKVTGHSDYQAMKPYIAIAEKTKADAMKLFDEELKK